MGGKNPRSAMLPISSVPMKDRTIMGYIGGETEKTLRNPPPQYNDVTNPLGAIAIAQRAQEEAKLKESQNIQGEKLISEGTASASRAESNKTVVVDRESSRDSAKKAYEDKDSVNEKKPSAPTPSREQIKEYFEDGM